VKTLVKMINSMEDYNLLVCIRDIFRIADVTFK